MSLNHNIVEKILSKLKPTNTIYKVTEKERDGCDNYIQHKYFHKMEDAYEYLRSGYVRSLTITLENSCRGGCTQDLYDHRVVPESELEEDRVKLESIKRLSNKRKMAERIYDDI